VEFSAIDFDDKQADLAPVSGPGVMDYLLMNTGTAINALALLAIAFLVVWFGLRPLGRSLGEAVSAQQALAAPMPGGFAGELTADGPAPFQIGDMGFATQELDDSGMPALKPSKAAALRERLAALVDADDAEVTKALKEWMKETRRT
jgi:flagellar M-ring protein FliF